MTIHEPKSSQPFFACSGGTPLGSLQTKNHKGHFAKRAQELLIVRFSWKKSWLPPSGMSKMEVCWVPKILPHWRLVAPSHWTYCLAPTSLTPEVSQIWLTFCTSRNCCIPRHPPSRPNTMNTRHVTWVAVKASSAWTFLDHLGRDGWCGKKLFSFPGRQRECYTHQTTMQIVLIWHLPQVSSPSFKQIEAAANKLTSAGLIESSFIIALSECFFKQHPSTQKCTGGRCNLKASPWCRKWTSATLSIKPFRLQQKLLELSTHPSKETSEMHWSQGQSVTSPSFRAAGKVSMFVRYPKFQKKPWKKFELWKTLRFSIKSLLRCLPKNIPVHKKSHMFHTSHTAIRYPFEFHLEPLLEKRSKSKAYQSEVHLKLVRSSPFENIWMFPKIGVPPNHPF